MIKALIGLVVSPHRLRTRFELKRRPVTSRSASSYFRFRIATGFLKRTPGPCATRINEIDARIFKCSADFSINSSATWLAFSRLQLSDRHNPQRRHKREIELAPVKKSPCCLALFPV